MQRLPGRRRFQDATPNLISLHADEQRFEIALTESIVAPAIDDLEKNGPDESVGKDL
jgi:hypothetical protein